MPQAGNEHTSSGDRGRMDASKIPPPLSEKPKPPPKGAATRRGLLRGGTALAALGAVAARAAFAFMTGAVRLLESGRA